MLGADELRGDCARCLALCCVLPAFSLSADFALTKPAGTACPHLRDDDRCAIHDRLRARGFAGCVAYDCFGAGQRVSQSAIAGAGWRGPDGASPVLDATFAAVRHRHELLWHLAAADGLLVELPGHEAAAVREQVRMCADDMSAYVDALLIPEATTPRIDDEHALALLRTVSQLARAEVPHRTADLRGADLLGADLAGTDLRGADLRGATLVGAVLRDADLRRADLAGADLRGADLRGADLGRCIFLTQAQLDAACGDMATVVDPPLGRPAHWTQQADPYASQAPARPADARRRRRRPRPPDSRQ